MSSQYLSCAETAKLVRAALKESFPGVKFGVRSSTYSGGASIRIDWTDGPNHSQVKAVADHFEGAYFDGMIDYKGYRHHLLDGKPVSLGANFIFCDRRHGDAAITRALRICEGKYGVAGTVEKFQSGNLWAVDTGAGENLQTMVHRELSKQSDRLKVEPSATLKRLQFIGDDGYGSGTVGPYFTGGGSCYKAMEHARQRQQEGSA